MSYLRRLATWWTGLAPSERVLYRALALLIPGTGLVYPPLALITPGSVLLLVFLMSFRRST